MERNLVRPFRPFDVGDGGLRALDLRALGAGLAREPEYASTGRGSITLVHDRSLTIVLTALRGGDAIDEHHTPGTGSVLLLDGRARLHADGRVVDLAPGNAVVFGAALPHSVEAAADSLLLIAFGGRAPAAGPG
jgi:quercetin dioxygenase-like cupin family protein